MPAKPAFRPDHTSAASQHSRRWLLYLTDRLALAPLATSRIARWRSVLPWPVVVPGQRRSRVWRWIGWAVLLWLTGLAAGFLYAQQPFDRHAGLVVDFGDGTVYTACVDLGPDGEASGEEVLQASGLALVIDYEMGGAVCKIDSQGCDYPSDPCWCECQSSPCVYWAYHHLVDGQWQYSTLGASLYTVHAGDVEGWAWGAGTVSQGAQPPLIPFDEICVAATATPTETATPMPTPTATPTAPPTATPTATATDTTTPTPPATPTPTWTPSQPPTETPLPTATWTPQPAPTDTPLPTATPTPRPTATWTPQPSWTPPPTATDTPLPTPTLRPTDTPTAAAPGPTVALRPKASAGWHGQVFLPFLARRHAGAAPSAVAAATLTPTPSPVPTTPSARANNRDEPPSRPENDVPDGSQAAPGAGPVSDAARAAADPFSYQPGQPLAAAVGSPAGGQAAAAPASLARPPYDRRPAPQLLRNRPDVVLATGDRGALTTVATADYLFLSALVLLLTAGFAGWRFARRGHSQGAWPARAAAGASSSLVTLGIYGLSAGIGVVAFLYPFLSRPAGSAAGSAGHGMDTPLLLTLLVGLCFVALLVEVQGQAISTRRIALLGILIAINSVLRFVEVGIPGPGGFSPIFFLIVLTGYVYGGRFGFLMGALTLLVSGLITGGIGPWLPGQMFAAGWVGLTAPLIRPVVRLAPGRQREKVEVVMLALFGALWGLAFGLVMNLWFWPFMSGPADQYWEAGLDVADTVRRYLAFYLATSLWWDVMRMTGNVALILAFGAATLRALRRFQQRFDFDYQPARAKWPPV